MNIRPYHLVVALLVVVLLQGSMLFMLGRSFICPCGLELWDAGVKGVESSQQAFDWYTFVHVMYGMMLYFVGWVLHKKLGWKMPVIFLLVLLASFGWEVFENTHYAINHYQTSSVSIDYYGDSILNSSIDTLVMMAGFSLAFLLPVWASTILFIAVAVLTTLVIRDNVFISTFVFIFPFKTIINWQAAAPIYQ